MAHTDTVHVSSCPVSACHCTVVLGQSQTRKQRLKCRIVPSHTRERRYNGNETKARRDLETEANVEASNDACVCCTIIVFTCLSIVQINVVLFDDAVVIYSTCMAALDDCSCEQVCSDLLCFFRFGLLDMRRNCLRKTSAESGSFFCGRIQHFK